MNAAVIVFPGSNCDRDLAVAIREVGGRAPAMVWHGEAELPEGLDLIAIPGGFSYGDYLRSGAMAARSPVMRAVVEAAGKGDSVTLATFDLSAEVLTAIKDGNMAFAIDQQQFIQGYLPIVFLTVYAETRNLPTGNGQGLLMTGPGFVTQENAEAVIGLAAEGLR